MDIKLKTGKQDNHTGNIQEKKNKHNNQQGKSRYISLLIILLAASIAAGFMLYSYPGFRNQAQTIVEKEKEKLKQEEKQKSYLWEDGSMLKDILFAVYYLDYRLSDEKDALNYYTRDYDTSKLSKEEMTALNASSDLMLHYMNDAYDALTLKDNDSGYGSFDYSGDILYSCCGAVKDEKGNVIRDYGIDKNLLQVLTGGIGALEARELPEKTAAVDEDTDDKGTVGTERYDSIFVLSFDKDGNPSVTESKNISGNPLQLTSYLQSAGISDLYFDTAWDRLWDAEIAPSLEGEGDNSYGSAQFEKDAMILKQIPLPAIKNKTFVFGMSSRDNSEKSGYAYPSYQTELDAWLLHGYLITALMIALIMALLALILQNIPTRSLRSNPVFRLPSEITAGLALLGIPIAAFMVYSVDFARITMGTDLREFFQTLGFGTASDYLAHAVVWIMWAMYSFFAYWLIASLLPYLTHPVRTLKERALFPRFLHWVRGKFHDILKWAGQIDLMEKDGLILRRMVLLNGLAIVLISCFWFWGVLLGIVYSICLYIWLMKRYRKVQEDYTRLLVRAKEIASSSAAEPGKERSGDPDYHAQARSDEIRDADTFYRMNEDLDRIEAGLARAVNAEVRSRNTKTELITNVSHDLKTPLTAIITYLDLLKKEDLSDELRKEYLTTLDAKAQRLKALIEDLFEASKAVTGDIVMNYAEVDLASLMKQVRMENEDRIEESSLDFRWNLPEEKCSLRLDPNRTWRIMDNLLQNTLKYSMPGTRVYVDMVEKAGCVKVIMKNISASEMNFNASEITDRFVRGDLARNTEGSGLGLAIARSFTELQGGRFEIEIDGDLFKVTVSFPVKRE